jgi:hypothetical protein
LGQPREHNDSLKDGEKPARKEVKTMKYTRPEIVVAGSAAASIQGGKPTGRIADVNPLKHQTPAAYEADE